MESEAHKQSMQRYRAKFTREEWLARRRRYDRAFRQRFAAMHTLSGWRRYRRQRQWRWRHGTSYFERRMDALLFPEATLQTVAQVYDPHTGDDRAGPVPRTRPRG